MIAKPAPWRAIPVDPIISMMPVLKWSTGRGLTGSRTAAALILYVTLIFVAERQTIGDILVGYRSSPTHDELEKLTGLSRALISGGLKLLIELELIELSGSRQSRVYTIAMQGKRWFNLSMSYLATESRPNEQRGATYGRRRSIAPLENSEEICDRAALLAKRTARNS
jgi:hypothetical protein